MKAIMMSIKPQWLEKILNGEKTIEIRKRFPKDYVGWVYIYCTKDGYLSENDLNPYTKYFAIRHKPRLTPNYMRGKVVARFWCDKVEDYVYGHKWSWESGAPMWGADNSYETILKDMCLTDEELRAYVDDLCFSAIHITKLEIFDRPKEISDFKRPKWEKCGVKDKNGLYQCHKCPYAIHYGHGFGDCGYDKPLKAPQSWCYVEV